MTAHTDFAALLVVAVSTIGYGPTALAQTIVEAKTWDEAISKLECKHITKNADGSYSVRAIIKINGYAQRNPIVNVPTYAAAIEAKKLPRIWRAGALGCGGLTLRAFISTRQHLGGW